MSNLSAYVDEMIKIWQSMRAAWDGARQSWKDKDRDQFEREHIHEFNDSTNSYIANLRRLAETIQQIRSDAP